MVDVFISYSRSDQPMVAMLAHAVEAAGYQVWWDAELPPHQSYGDVITDKIANAKAAIVVWSAGAVKSEWVRAEADMARNQRKLIQTALDNVTPPLPFNQIQYAEMGDWRGEDDHPGWRKVKLSLAELCGQRGTAEPSTRPIPPPPPQYQPQAQVQSAAAAAPNASRGPLFAGIGIAVVALAVAGGMLLGRGSSAPAPAAPAPAPAVESPAAAAVSTPVVQPAAPDTPVAAAAAPAAPLDPDQEAALKPNPADMEFADSSTRLLTAAEVAGLGPTTLRVARNEIYARKGRRFNDPWLREWFGRYAWYKPLHDQVKLNPIEQRNVDLLQQAEQPYR
jgi:hypothetical protein